MIPKQTCYARIQVHSYRRESFEEHGRGFPSRSFIQVVKLFLTGLSLRATDERRTLSVVKDNTTATADPNSALDDPEEREDGERERRPVSERIRALVRKDSPQAPRDSDAAGQVSLRSGERVCSTGALEEEEAEEYEDLGPDASLVLPCVDAEGLEGGQNNKDGRPAVVEREGEVDEDLVSGALWLVELLHDVVDVLWRRR